MSDIPDRFPKVESPYHRAENEQGDYVIEGFSGGPEDYVKSKFSWVFDRADEVEAIEKLDGTNMAVRLRDPSQFEHDPAMVVDVATRMGDKSMNEVDPFGPTNHHYIARAVQNSKRRGYLDYLLDEHGTGWFFGEAVGPKMQGNPHELDEHLFVPFEWIRDKLEYRSYGDYPTDFESIRDWFRGEANGLFSLFASRMHGQDLEASRPTNGTFVEGLVLIHPDFDGRIRPRDLTLGNGGQSVKELAKLRRDQFSAFARGEWPLTDYSHH